MLSTTKSSYLTARVPLRPAGPSAHASRRPAEERTSPSPYAMSAATMPRPRPRNRPRGEENEPDIGAALRASHEAHARSTREVQDRGRSTTGVDSSKLFRPKAVGARATSGAVAESHSKIARVPCLGPAGRWRGKKLCAAFSPLRLCAGAASISRRGAWWIGPGIESLLAFAKACMSLVRLSFHSFNVCYLHFKKKVSLRRQSSTLALLHGSRWKLKLGHLDQTYDLSFSLPRQVSTRKGPQKSRKLVETSLGVSNNSRWCRRHWTTLH